MQLLRQSVSDLKRKLIYSANATKKRPKSRKNRKKLLDVQRKRKIV